MRSPITFVLLVLMLTGLIVCGATESVPSPPSTQPSSSTTPSAATQAATRPAEEQAEKPAYVASVRGKVYHLPDCRWAKTILPKNQVTFDTREAAERTGRQACGTCRP